MADIRQLTADYAVAPQLAVEDLPAVAAAGFATIVANRPDGEAPGQPGMDDIEAAATKAGLSFVRIPISGPPTPAAIEIAEKTIASARGPILAYCRSGTRSATLWALATAKAGKMPTTDILEAARRAGYDLGGQKGALDRLQP